jgi:hypothetical protein
MAMVPPDVRSCGPFTVLDGSIERVRGGVIEPEQDLIPIVTMSGDTV